MSEEQKHPSKYLRQAAAQETCAACGFSYPRGYRCPNCAVAGETETGPRFVCGCCGYSAIDDFERCPRCEEQQQVLEEERRRGVREEEPLTQLLAAEAIGDALPILWQAAIYAGDRELWGEIMEHISALGDIKFHLERGH